LATREKDRTSLHGLKLTKLMKDPTTGLDFSEPSSEGREE